MTQPTIIRDDNGPVPSCYMLALMIDWGVDVKQCGVTGCEEPPNTIINQGHTLFGLCETHYKAAAIPGGAKFTLARYAQRDTPQETVQ